MNSKSKLSPVLLEKAKNELGEDENKRNHMLAQFRDWIKNHPYIRHCRQDDVFLLRFLRAKKFSFMNATSMLESYLTAFKVFPQYFQNLDITDPKISQLINSGYCLALPERDSDGSRVFLVRTGRVDTEKFTSAEIMSAMILLIELFLDEEETQVCGGKLVIDFANTSMKFFGLFSIVDLKNMTTLSQKILACRQKGYYLLNLPSGARTLIQFVLSLLSEKLKSRTHFLKAEDEVNGVISPTSLPKEYGGTLTTDQIIKHMRDRLTDERDRLLLMKKDDIIISKVPSWAANVYVTETDNGVAGSFRKLEVD